MSILNHSDATAEERDEYAKVSSAIKRMELEAGEGACISPADTGLLDKLTPEQFIEMRANEQFILTVTSTGYGKRSSSYEYRVTGRGGSGIAKHGNVRPQQGSGQFVPD